MFFDKLILLLKVDDRAGAQTHKPRTVISHNIETTHHSLRSRGEEFWTVSDQFLTAWKHV